MNCWLKSHDKMYPLNLFTFQPLMVPSTSGLSTTSKLIHDRILSVLYKVLSEFYKLSFEENLLKLEQLFLQHSNGLNTVPTTMK